MVMSITKGAMHPTAFRNEWWNKSDHWGLAREAHPGVNTRVE